MSALDFERMHEAEWSELESMADRKDSAIDPARFGDLYRKCCEHLAMAQARDYPAHIVDRLSAVTAQSHQILYRRTDFGLARIARVLYLAFPAQVRRDWAYMLASLSLFIVPTLAMGIATYRHPELVLSFLDENTVSQFESMYSPSAESIGRTRDAATDLGMFGYYIMNNIGVAFRSFASGLVFGIGSVLMILFNGLYGGAVAGYLAARGLGGTFFPFVVTHSAFELTAIVFAGGAGLKIGRAVLLPGRAGRTAALEKAARESGVVVFGAAVMLLIAAGLEAFWSSAVWVAPMVKYEFGGLCWCLVVLFFLRRPRAS